MLDAECLSGGIVGEVESYNCCHLPHRPDIDQSACAAAVDALLSARHRRPLIASMRMLLRIRQPAADALHDRCIFSTVLGYRTASAARAHLVASALCASNA